MSVKWIDPDQIISKISATNYLANVPGMREKSQIYHVNLLKLYVKRIKKINALIHKFQDFHETQDLEIDFPSANSSSYKFSKVLEESNLRNRCTPEQLHELEDLLDEFQEVYSLTTRV